MSGKLVVLKKVDNAVLYEGGIIKVLNVRASYPHLAEAYAGEDGGKPAFSVTGLLKKETHKDAALMIRDAIEALALNKKAKIAKDKRCLRNGDDGDKEEAFGHYTLSARDTKRPKIRGKDNEILAPDEVEELFYGGCYVDILFRLWYQDNKFGKRVNANLTAVRFRADGEPFGEGRIDDGEAWEDDEGGFDDDGVDDDDEI